MDAVSITPYLIPCSVILLSAFEEEGKDGDDNLQAPLRATIVDFYFYYFELHVAELQRVWSAENGWPSRRRLGRFFHFTLVPLASSDFEVVGAPKNATGGDSSGVPICSSAHLVFKSNSLHVGYWGVLALFVLLAMMETRQDQVERSEKGTKRRTSRISRPEFVSGREIYCVSQPP